MLLIGKTPRFGKYVNMFKSVIWYCLTKFLSLYYHLFIFNLNHEGPSPTSFLHTFSSSLPSQSVFTFFFPNIRRSKKYFLLLWVSQILNCKKVIFFTNQINFYNSEGYCDDVGGAWIWRPVLSKRRKIQFYPSSEHVEHHWRYRRNWQRAIFQSDYNNFFVKI